MVQYWHNKSSAHDFNIFDEKCIWKIFLTLKQSCIRFLKNCFIFCVVWVIIYTVKLKNLLTLLKMSIAIVHSDSQMMHLCMLWSKKFPTMHHVKKLVSVIFSFFEKLSSLLCKIVSWKIVIFAKIVVFAVEFSVLEQPSRIQVTKWLDKALWNKLWLPNLNVLISCH